MGCCSYSWVAEVVCTGLKFGIGVELGEPVGVYEWLDELDKVKRQLKHGQQRVTEGQR